MAKGKPNSRLKYTDLFALISKLGVEKNVNLDVLKTIITTHKTYGSEYLINGVTKLVYEAEKYKFQLNRWPFYLRKIVLINYWASAYKHFKDLNYYKAIEEFSNNHDNGIKTYAKATLERLTEN